MWIILKETARQVTLPHITEISIDDSMRNGVPSIGISIRNLDYEEDMFIATKDRLNAERAYTAFANAIRQKLDSVDLTGIK